MESKIAIQKQLINNNETYPTSYYKMMKIGAQSNSNPWISTSTSQTTFEIPGGNVINLSRMRLSFLRGVASAAGADTYFQYLYTSFFPFIQHIELFTSWNIQLVDINYVDAYNKICSPCVLNYKKRNKIDAFLYPALNRELKSPKTMELTVPTVNGIANTSGNFSPFVATANNGALTPSVVLNIDDPDYIVCSAVATALPSETVQFNILLKDLLPDSIFAMDTDLYIQKVLYFRITWNNVINCGWSWKWAIGAEAGLALACSFPLWSLSISIYVQANPVIEQMTKLKFAKQQEIIIPYIQANSITLWGSYQSTSVKVISNSLKSSLYKTYNLITAADIVKNVLNSNNLGGVKWTWGKLYVNADLILDLNVTQWDDYKHVTTQHKNHSFINSQFFYDVSPFVNVFDSEPINENTPYDGSLKGKTFDNSGNEILINHQFNTAWNNYNHYIFAVILKAYYFLNGEISTSPFI